MSFTGGREIVGTSAKYRKHVCNRCGKTVDNMSALEQQVHINNCKGQTKLGDFNV